MSTELCCELPLVFNHENRLAIVASNGDGSTQDEQRAARRMIAESSLDSVQPHTFSHRPP